jgi:hypothetical protein
MNNVLNPIKLIALASLIVGSSMSTAIAQEEEEGNYYLEQMRKQSQTETGQPDQALPEQDAGLFAESDLEDLTKIDEDLADIDEEKPEFDKPKLDIFKPEL